MSELFSSLAADLRDRRFLPIAALLGAALIAAVAYAVLGASSTGSAPAPRASGGGAGSGSIAITRAPETAAKQALAETTSGAPRQTGSPRDPFKPLPGAGKAPSSTQAASASATASGSSPSRESSPASSGEGSSSPGSSPGAGESRQSSGEANASTPSQPSAPAKPQTRVLYQVTLQFGMVPQTAEGAPAQPAQLQMHRDAAPKETLPSRKEPLVVFSGAGAGGKSATFKLVGEVILHGPAVCRPSASQCESIALKPGQSETFETIGRSGQAATYELKLLAIEKSEGAAGAARAARQR